VLLEPQISFLFQHDFRELNDAFKRCQKVMAETGVDEALRLVFCGELRYQVDLAYISTTQYQTVLVLNDDFI
jgi:hypothetical protein